MFGLRGLTSGAQALPTGVGAADAALTAPYLGLGYTGWLTKTGLSFSADLGVTAERPGARWQFGGRAVRQPRAPTPRLASFVCSRACNWVCSTPTDHQLTGRKPPGPAANRRARAGMPFAV